MRRLVMLAVIAGPLVLCMSLDTQAQLSKGVATGTLKKLDVKTGMIVLEVPVRIGKTKKKENKELTYTITDDTKIVLLAGEEKEEKFGKKSLTSPLIKVGAQTSAFFDKDNKVYEVRFGAVATKTKKKN
ncbi:MAG: hypothetical protein AB7K24_10215 [Gemmataceae bacterium]